MRTLHSYFGRELLKTFLMTCAALTLLIVMGGGVANIFRSEGIGAQEMVRIFTYLTPIAITLILPVAALFSATITFGRAAADNEVLACQAAGINIHRILLAPALLGLGVTIVTYVSWNYMIPYLTGQIENTTRRDLPAIVLGQFMKNKPLIYGKHRIAARHCERVPTADLPEEYRSGHTFLRLRGVTFIEADEQEFTRFGTADETIIDFNVVEATPKVTLQMEGVRIFDSTRRQSYALKNQIVGPYEIPLPIKRKIKFENLDTLAAWRASPKEIPEVRDMLHGMRREMMVYFLSQAVDAEMSDTGRFQLIGEGFRIELSSERIALDKDDGRTRLNGVTAHVIRGEGEPIDVYLAADATIELSTGINTKRPMIVVEMVGDVQISREPAGPDDQIVKKPNETLPRVEFRDQPALMDRFDAFDMSTLFDAVCSVPLLPKPERARQKLVERVSGYEAELTGEIHFRASYALDAIAIVVLGAMLGIIVRGGQVLTAFGVSCAPLLVVVIASIVGRNLADYPAHVWKAVGVMWGSMGLMYLATAYVGTRVLRR